MRTDEKENEIETLRAQRNDVQQRLNVAKGVIEDLLDDVEWYRKTFEVEHSVHSLREYATLMDFATARTLHGDPMLLIQLGYDHEVSRFRRVHVGEDAVGSYVVVGVQGRKKRKT